MGANNGARVDSRFQGMLVTCRSAPNKPSPENWEGPSRAPCQAMPPSHTPEPVNVAGEDAFLLIARPWLQDRRQKLRTPFWSSQPLCRKMRVRSGALTGLRSLPNTAPSLQTLSTVWRTRASNQAPLGMLLTLSMTWSVTLVDQDLYGF